MESEKRGLGHRITWREDEVVVSRFVPVEHGVPSVEGSWQQVCASRRHGVGSLDSIDDYSLCTEGSGYYMLTQHEGRVDKG